MLGTAHSMMFGRQLLCTTGCLVMLVLNLGKTYIITWRNHIDWEPNVDIKLG